MSPNALSKPQTSSLPMDPPRPIGRDLAAAIDRIAGAARWSTWSRCAIPAEHAPSAELRRAIEARGRELDIALTCGTLRAITARVTDLLEAFPATDTGAPEDAARRVRLYVEQIADQPIWAVDGAVRAFLSGEKGPLRFAPTAPELAHAVKLLSAGPRDERAKVRTILSAQIDGPDDPAMKKRISEALKALGLEFRERHFEKRAEPPPLDPDLLAQVPDRPGGRRRA